MLNGHDYHDQDVLQQREHRLANLEIKLLPNQQRDIQRLAECSGSQLKMKPISEVEAGNLLPVFAELNKLDFDFHVYDIEPCLHI